MGEKKTHRGSPEAPVVFVGIPWLINGNRYEAYLESCLAHIEVQECPKADLLPPFLTEPVDVPPDFEFANPVDQMSHVTAKVNEIIEEFLKSGADYLWIVDADTEVPSDALCKLLELDADVASGLSPPHSSKKKTTALVWQPPPSPEYEWSKPWYKPLRMKDAYGRILGGDQNVATGHFCLLCKRRVFERFSPKFEPIRFKWDPPQKMWSEVAFWRDAQELEFVCRIDGNIVVGHLPEFPLEALREWLNG